MGALMSLAGLVASPEGLAKTEREFFIWWRTDRKVPFDKGNETLLNACLTAIQSASRGLKLDVDVSDFKDCKKYMDNMLMSTNSAASELKKKIADLIGNSAVIGLDESLKLLKSGLNISVPMGVIISNYLKDPTLVSDSDMEKYVKVLNETPLSNR